MLVYMTRAEETPFEIIRGLFRDFDFLKSSSVYITTMFTYVVTFPNSPIAQTYSDDD